MTADELAKILDELGQRLGPTGEYVFGMAVKNVWVTSLMAAVGGLLAVVTATVVVAISWHLYRRSVKAYKADGSASRYDRPDAFYYFFPTGAFAAFCGVGGLVLLLTAIPSLIVPEYAALRDLIGAIR